MDTRMVDASEECIAEAARLLGHGELVAIPTETVYGLAAHAFDADAVLSVFAAKERPTFDPLIVHVTQTSLDSLGTVIDLGRMSSAARARADALTELWPGPLTLVLPKGAGVPDHVTSGLDTVAVRAPSHPVARQVIDALGAPVVAPSANRFGRISPTTAAHVVDELQGRIPLVVDGGATTHGVESTIVGVEDDGSLVLLRPGATPTEAIEQIAKARLAEPSAQGSPKAPGMLASHYAPRKPVVIEGGLTRRGAVGWLLFASESRPEWTKYGDPVAVERLGADDRQAARGLFAALRRLDASDAAWILVEEPRFEGGLGPAIRDRLSRAAATRES